MHSRLIAEYALQNQEVETTASASFSWLPFLIIFLIALLIILLLGWLICKVQKESEFCLHCRHFHTTALFSDSDLKKGVEGGSSSNNSLVNQWAQRQNGANKVSAGGYLWLWYLCEIRSGLKRLGAFRKGTKAIFARVYLITRNER